MRAALFLLLLLPLAASAHDAPNHPPEPPLPPGEYLCRVSSEYKNKPCTVELKDGKLLLVAKEGGLFGFEGTVTKQDPFILVTAHHTDRRPFGCYSCAERCAKPGSCMCDEVPPEASSECLAQPLYIVLRSTGRDTWSGSVVVRNYSNTYAEGGGVNGVQHEPWVIEVTLKKKK
jgi:hypothetical protein